jgi:hypothetical protein
LIYYTYVLYAGLTPEEGLWKVEVHGNDVNWDYLPKTDDFSQELNDTAGRHLGRDKVASNQNDSFRAS